MDKDNGSIRWAMLEWERTRAIALRLSTTEGSPFPQAEWIKTEEWYSEYRWRYEAGQGWATPNPSRVV